MRNAEWVGTLAFCKFGTSRASRKQVGHVCLAASRTPDHLGEYRVCSRWLEAPQDYPVLLKISHATMRWHGMVNIINIIDVSNAKLDIIYYTYLNFFFEKYF